MPKELDGHDHRTARPPLVVWLGLAVVLLAAAILSFEELRNLALAVGISPRWAWLLPIAVDAGAAVSCSVWLGGRSTQDAARFAGRMTWALLATTVAGNAAQLGMASAHITPPWWCAVLVGAIPPAVVGATVHLVVLLVRRTTAADTGEITAPVADDQPPTVVEEVTAPDPPRLVSLTRPQPHRTPPPRRADRNDDDALAALYRWIETQGRLPLTTKEARAATGAGYGKAMRVWEQVRAEHAATGTGGA